jgi:hypothetical protein
MSFSDAAFGTSKRTNDPGRTGVGPLGQDDLDASDAIMKKVLESRREQFRQTQYSKLWNMLCRAYEQASEGKGRERHASDDPFEQQEICEGIRKCGTGAATFQVRKKILEAARLMEKGEYEQALTDILGAIVYASAFGIVVDEKLNAVEKDETG